MNRSTSVFSGQRASQDREYPPLLVLHLVAPKLLMTESEKHMLHRLCISGQVAADVPNFLKTSVHEETP